MSYFTEEALEKFQAMCAEGMDFAEGEEYDFVQCLMASGDIYGVEPGETCEKGKQISDERAAELKAKKSEKNSSNARMSKLKAAFRKKTGRDMTADELKKAAWMADKTKAPKK